MHLRFWHFDKISKATKIKPEVWFFWLWFHCHFQLQSLLFIVNKKKIISVFFGHIKSLNYFMIITLFIFSLLFNISCTQCFSWNAHRLGKLFRQSLFTFQFQRNKTLDQPHTIQSDILNPEQYYRFENSFVSTFSCLELASKQVMVPYAIGFRCFEGLQMCACFWYPSAIHWSMIFQCCQMKIRGLLGWSVLSSLISHFLSVTCCVWDELSTPNYFGFSPSYCDRHLSA